MKLLTYGEYYQYVLANPYFQGRWAYIRHVLELIPQYNPKTVLEIGANGLPLCRESVTIDKRPGATICWDIDKVPWPIDTLSKDTFDLGIALQVWEHLKNPKEAWQEFRRHCRHIIMSLPLEWDDVTHNIKEADILTWFDPPVCRIILPTNKKRVLYTW